MTSRSISDYSAPSWLDQFSRAMDVAACHSTNPDILTLRKGIIQMMQLPAGSQFQVGPSVDTRSIVLVDRGMPFASAHDQST